MLLLLSFVAVLVFAVVVGDGDCGVSGIAFACFLVFVLVVVVLIIMIAFVLVLALLLPFVGFCVCHSCSFYRWW